MGKGSSTWLRSGATAAAAAPVVWVCVGEEPRSGESSLNPSDEGPLSWITGLASLLKWMVSCSIQLWPEQHSSATAKHLLCPSREGNGQTKWNFALVTKAMNNLGNQGKVTLLFVLQYPLLWGNESISVSRTLIQKNIGWKVILSFPLTNPKNVKLLVRPGGTGV